ncbi:MAG: GvpL/GvpF family gas vesicle protein [Chloroflexi bacterium]|nr:GvpL/GvpF family gas vesicle protein [Chloroflexota bacterium]
MKGIGGSPQGVSEPAHPVKLDGDLPHNLQAASSPSSKPGAAPWPTGSIWHLYGVTRCCPQESARVLDELGSDAPAPVWLLPCGNLGAVARPLAPSEFAAEAIGEQSRDAGWLEALVRGHERVLEAVHQERGILPAKLGCVYSSVATLEVMLEHDRSQLLTQLERVEGCDEWDVRVLVERAVSRQQAGQEDQTARRLQEELTSAKPGRSYFLQQKLKETLAAATERRLHELAEASWERLRPWAVTAQRLPRRRGVQPASHETQVLHAVFLVHRTTRDTFVAALYEFAASQPGLRAEYSGPWPPFNFTTVEEAAS